MNSPKEVQQTNRRVHLGNLLLKLDWKDAFDGSPIFWAMASGNVGTRGGLPWSPFFAGLSGRPALDTAARRKRRSAGILLVIGCCLFAAEAMAAEPTARSQTATNASNAVVTVSTRAATRPLNGKSGEPDLPQSGGHSSTNSMDNLDDLHQLAVGDQVSFRIEEDLEDPKSLLITDSGDLEVPYIGRFPAETKTCRQLAKELKVALEKEYYYQATVIIAVNLMAKSRGKVYLVGPVRVPGPQEIPSDETLTLSKAIMRAGGFNEYADRRNVKVTRKARPDGREKMTFVVDVGQIFDKGKVDLDQVLEPDDFIVVPERMLRF